MKRSRFLLGIVCFLLAFSAQAGEPPVLSRFKALEKSSSAKLLNALGAGELPPLFAHLSAISADGKTAVYADFVSAADKAGDTRLLVWDIAAGRFRQEILVAGQQATALALSPDGSAILLGAVHDDKKRGIHSVSLWSVATGKRLRLLGEQKGPVTALAFSSKGNEALSAGGGQLRWSDLTGGKERQIFAGDENDALFAVAFHPNGKHALCGVNQTLRVIDLTSSDPKKAILKEFTEHKDWIISVAVSPDGKTAISASRDNTIRSWDLDKGKPLHVLGKTTVPANCWISFGLGDDGKTVFSAWSNGDSDTGAATLSLWDAATGKEIWTRAGNYRGIVPIRVRGQQALIGGGCNVLAQWDLANGTIQRSWGGHKGAVNAVCADSKNRFYSAGQDGFVHVWEKDQISRSIAAHDEPILAIALNPKETLLLTASADKTVKVWELATGKLRKTLAGHHAAVTTLALTRDGTRVCTASGDRSIKLWDLETGKSLATLTGHSEGINAIALSADETWLASGSDDASIRLWPLKDDKLDPAREVAVLEQHAKAVTCLAFSRDGKTLLSASQDKTLKIWDWPQGKVLRNVPGHKNWITSLLVLDAESVLTTSDDLTLCRWNLDTGKETGQIDFGVIGDCPRCVAPLMSAGRILVGTSSWMLFEFEWAARKTKTPKGTSEE